MLTNSSVFRLLLGLFLGVGPAWAESIHYECIAIQGTSRGALFGITLNGNQATLDYSAQCRGTRAQHNSDRVVYSGFGSCGSQDQSAELEIEPGLRLGKKEGWMVWKSSGVMPFKTLFRCSL